MTQVQMPPKVRIGAASRELTFHAHDRVREIDVTIKAKATISIGDTPFASFLLICDLNSLRARMGSSGHVRTAHQVEMGCEAGMTDGQRITAAAESLRAALLQFLEVPVAEALVSRAHLFMARTLDGMREGV